MKRFGGESGQTLIFVALGMTVMLGFVGFATDVGVLLHEKREVQTAADSAAIAAALEMLEEGGPTTINSSITTAAKNDAALNGFTDGVNGATVTVSMSPSITVPTFNTAGYVQATVTQSTPDFFMKLFGRDSMNVSATAVATELGGGPPCMTITNDANAAVAVSLSGNSLIAAGTCGIPVTGPIDFTGNKATIDAGYVTSTSTISGNAGVNINAPYAQYAPPATDPLATRLQSSIPTVSNGTCTSPDGTTPCWYDYGLNAAGTGYQQGVTGTANVTASTLPNGQLPTGVYYYDIPVNISGSISSAPGGITFFLAQSVAFDFAANGTVNLSGLSSGTFNNVLIDAPTDTGYTTCTNGNMPNNGQPGQLHFDFGSSTTTLTGIVYAPAAEMFVQDSGASLTFNTDLVLGNLCMQSASFTINGLPSGAASTKVGLVY